MKTIFLDFDGVITIPPRWNMDLSKIQIIKNIVDATGAKIIVSSSWRRNSIEETKIAICNRIKNAPELMRWFVENLYDVTGIGANRGKEINQYLLNHKDITNYIIIDDDSDMLPEQLFHFIQTDWGTGITTHEEELAIKILNNEYVYNVLGLNFELRNAWVQKCNNNTTLWDFYIQYNDLVKSNQINI